MAALPFSMRTSSILVIAELHPCMQSPIAKKIWLSIHLRNFGSHMTVYSSVSPSTPQGNQGEMSHFLASEHDIAHPCCGQ